MSRRAGECGQTTPEYVGLIVLFALVAATFGAINLGPGIAGALQDALCRVAGAECSGAATPVAAGPAVPLADPNLTPADRTILMDADPQVPATVLEPFTPAELAWLELNDPEAYAAALEATSWAEQHELLDAALEADLDGFADLKDSESHDPRMDYSDDGCSVPVVGSSSDPFHFRPSCERHDFGYRNAKRLGLFDGYKQRIDSVFAKDLHDACEDVIFFARRQCRTAAASFYNAVRVAGGSCNPPGPIERVPGPCAPEHG